MDTRYLIDARARARGAVRPTYLAIVGVFVLLAIGAWFFIMQPYLAQKRADAGSHPSASTTAATPVASVAPVNVAGMGVDQLVSEARAAMGQQRYLAPVGNNAFEFYLRVLVKDPGNKVAADALRETFPFAANQAEQAINARDFTEAQREIDLLAKADPTNFTLTILRSKLDAQRKTLDQQQQQALDAQKTSALAAAQQAAASKAATQQLAQQQEQLAVQQKAVEQAAAAPARKEAASTEQAVTRAADSATASAPTGPTTEAVLTKAAAPHYPTAAIRSHQKGWVVVSFTVDKDGSTSNIKVVDAEPRRVFDRAAVDAVEQYRFTPAMKGGVPVTSVRQQRIEFAL